MLPDQKTDLAVLKKTLSQVLSGQRKYLPSQEKKKSLQGKFLRPRLLFLTYRLCRTRSAGQRRLPQKVVKAAASLEILHHATLLHDDIVDQGLRRRGLPSLNALKGDELALLAGDLQMVESMKLYASEIRTPQDMGFVRSFLESASQVCRGEIDELLIKPSHRPDLLLKNYYRVVDRKTARLFSFACEAGGWLAKAPRQKCQALRCFGSLLGRAFQIQDDIKDLWVLGNKTPLRDLKNKVNTLPVIYALKTPFLSRPLKKMLKKPSPSLFECRQMAQLIRNSSVLDRCYGEARRFLLKAWEALEPFPQSPVKTQLEELSWSLIDGENV